MRIYELFISESSQLLEPVGDYKAMNALTKNDPEPCSDWQVLELRRMVEEEENDFELTDFTSVGIDSRHPLCSSRVRETLATVCGVSGQWLGVDFPEKEYSMLNLTHVIDALDAENSTLKYFKSSGNFDGIKRYAFFPELIEDEWIFREKTDRHGVFCTPRFVDLIKQEGWTGVELAPVWDSEHEPFMMMPERSEILSRPEIYGPDGFIGGFQHVWPKEWFEDKSVP